VGHAKHTLKLNFALQYGTLQFGKFEEIRKVGYDAAIKILDKWSDEGVLPSAVVNGSPGTSTKGRAARRNSI
jgi:lysophospholipid hydrolase